MFGDLSTLLFLDATSQAGDSLALKADARFIPLVLGREVLKECFCG